MPRKPDNFTPVPTFPSGHEKEGQARCRAWARTRGEQCSNNPVDGSDLCRMHGGKSLKGAAHPRFRHGERSKYLPPVLKGIYEERTTDPELLALYHEAALLDARITQCLRDLDDYGGVNFYVELGRIVREMRKAKDEDQRGLLLTQLLQTIERGRSEVDAWEDIRRYIDDKRKLVKDETRRRLQVQQLYTQEDINNYQTTLFIILTEVMKPVPGYKQILQEATERLVRAFGERPEAEA